jgi:DNA-binding LacI/PurR family transcriptional regulator
MTDEILAKPRRATVVDVARAARVSPGTVSNAISGKRKVDEETRKRIEAAIDQLGYIPNLSARRMRTGRSNTIAIFSSMPTAVAAGPSKLGFLMEIAASAAVTALEFNSALLLIPPIDDPIKAIESISMDGALIVEPEENDLALDLMQRRGVPTVTIGKPLGADSVYVDLDYHATATLLIDHLFALGARHFPLIVGQSARQTNLVFKEVYRARAAEHGMVPRILEIPESTAEDSAAAVIDRHIRSGAPMDGVLVPIDAMAAGVMRELRRHALRVPQDVRVVTRYDGLRARSEQPPMTAVDMQLAAVATIATRCLADLIESRAVPRAIAVPAPTLIVRGSSLCGPPTG